MTRIAGTVACVVLAGCGRGSEPTMTTTTASTPARSSNGSDTATSATSMSATTTSAPSSSVGVTPLACPPVAYRPQSSDLADNISALDTDCSTATGVVAAAPDRPHAGQAYQADGFDCRPGPESEPPGGGMSHIPYRCTNAAGAVVTFDRY